MKKMFLLAALAVCAVAYAESVNLYTMDFESGEGYTAGQLSGQNGWAPIAWFCKADTANVVTDSSKAASGDNYVAWVDTKDDINLAVDTDISEDYEDGMKLVISGSLSRIDDYWSEMYVKVQNLGTTGKDYDVEVFEIFLNKDGVRLTGATMDGASEKSAQISSDGSVEAWHDFAVTIDPATRTIVKAVADGVETNFTAMAYKSVNGETGGAFTGSSAIPDSLRLMKKGGFDNYKIDMVPEPAIFGLLALCGLFLRRK